MKIRVDVVRLISPPTIGALSLYQKRTSASHEGVAIGPAERQQAIDYFPDRIWFPLRKRPTHGPVQKCRLVEKLVR